MTVRVFSAISTCIYIALTAPVAAQSSRGEQICQMAMSYLKRNDIALQDGAMFASGSLSGGAQWVQAPSLLFGKSDFKLNAGINTVYLAYVMTRPAPSSGALSAKIALKTGNTKEKTNYFEIYRPEIARGSNPCDPRRRAEINSTVRINQYLDYHSENARRNDTLLEAFHFKFPVDGTSCAATNDRSRVKSFQFEGVDRTTGDTLLARYVPLIGSAYAINHEYSILRSELHYRKDVNSIGTCYGFTVPLGAAREASFIINEHGFGDNRPSPAQKAWLIYR